MMRTNGPSKSVWVSAALLAVILFLCVSAGSLARFPYDQQHLQNRLEPPNATYWFGTDDFGRDVYSRVLLGTRYSLAMGLGAASIALLVGVPAGLIGGYKRGRIDGSIMRTMDVLMSFPPIVLGMVVLAVTEPSLWKTILAVGIVYVPITARVTRGVTLSIAQEQFVAAAQARGEKLGYILMCEILPNAWSPIIVEGSLRITFSILLGAGLSFLGLGPQPPAPDWGLMINEARPYITMAPWMALAPGIAMCITVVTFNLLGDGLREMLDPRSTADRSIVGAT